MQGRLLGVLAVAAAATTWGSLGIFAKMLYAEGVSFEALVAFRAGIGWLAELAFLLIIGGARRLKVARRDLALLVPLGFVGIGAFYLLYFYTVQESTVGTAAILLYSSPAFVVVLARLFLGEALGAVKVAALILTTSGIFLVPRAPAPAAPCRRRPGAAVSRGGVGGGQGCRADPYPLRHLPGRGRLRPGEPRGELD